jgi:hypothetical protein
MIALLAPAPAGATLPYRVEMVGCVIEGFLFGESGHALVPRHGRSDRDYGLGPFEGQQLALEGWLYPGDLIRLTAEPRVVGPCPPEIRTAADNAWAWLRHADHAIERGDWASALTAIDRSHALRPTACTARRARILARLGRDDEAAADARRSLADAACSHERPLALDVLKRLEKP